MKKNIFKVAALVALCMMLAFCTSAFAAEEKFPSRMINLIFPQAAGGAVEQAARIWQPYVEKELGVPLNFEFFTGAGSLVGYNVMLERARDGYNIGVFAPASMANVILTMNAKFKVEDFDYIGIPFMDPGILFAYKDAPWNNLQELVDYAKTQPRESISVAVAAIGDVNILGLRQLEDELDIKFNIVPFNGGGKARTALAGNQVPLGIFMYYGSSPIWDNTKVLAINVKSTNIPELKDAQTFNQVAGKTLDDVFSSNGMMLPGGVKEQHPDRYQFLVDAFTRAFQNPELIAQLEKMEQKDWLAPIMGDDCLKYTQEQFEYFKRNLNYLKGE